MCASHSTKLKLGSFFSTSLAASRGFSLWSSEPKGRNLSKVLGNDHQGYCMTLAPYLLHWLPCQLCWFSYTGLFPNFHLGHKSNIIINPNPHSKPDVTSNCNPKPNRLFSDELSLNQFSPDRGSMGLPCPFNWTEIMSKEWHYWLTDMIEACLKKITCWVQIHGKIC